LGVSLREFSFQITCSLGLIFAHPPRHMQAPNKHRALPLLTRSKGGEAVDGALIGADIYDDHAASIRYMARRELASVVAALLLATLAL